MKVAQILPSLSRGDAIGDFTFFIDEFLKSRGHHSAIFADGIHKSLRGQAQRCQSADPSGWDLVINHYSIHSEPIEKLYLQCPGQRSLIYHNVTPDYFFKSYDAAFSELLKNGRQRFSKLAHVTDFSLADSQFNAQELSSLGFANPTVLGIPLSESAVLNARGDTVIESVLNDGWVNLLFCGRVAPNKCQEDLIRLLAWYQKYVRKRSRLILVGTGMDAYLEDLDVIAQDLGVRDSVVFAGRVPNTEHAAFFRSAHVFVSMSEHEGFCVPLLEAMAHRVPIVAFEGGAVKETLGGAGLSFAGKDMPLMAEMIEELVTNLFFRRAMIAQQLLRLKDFSHEAISTKLDRFLAHVKGRP
jgi:glycosyltransferase involved in cell wall biosynthesis